MPKKRKRRRSKSSDVVKVTADIHNKFVRILNRTHHLAFPPCYLLGTNENGTVASAIYINTNTNDNEGCGEMPDLNIRGLSLAMVKLVKKSNHTPCGLARIGDFSPSNSGRGYSLLNLYHIAPRAFIISFTSEWARAETDKERYYYSVVDK